MADQLQEVNGIDQSGCLELDPGGNWSNIDADAFESLDARQLLAWALQQFGPRKVGLACSFQVGSVSILHMLTSLTPEPYAFYLDTAVLFEETYATRDAVEERLGVTVERFASQYSLAGQEEQFGPALWNKNPDRCCQLRKVEPLKRALKPLDAWITGVRRDESAARQSVGKVEWDAKFGLLKINPLADWTHDEVWEYTRQHDLPYNDLYDEGYTSIGCTHCTAKPGDGDLRSGRWQGQDKTECGIHGYEDLVKQHQAQQEDDASA